MPRRRLATALCLWSLLTPAACATAGNFVWYGALPREEAGGDYLVAPGDLLSIRVLNHDEMMTRARVRSDGRIAIPIIGEVQARGKTPNVVRVEIEDRLKTYLVAPAVTVNVEESQQTTFSVLGEVSHPGVFPLEHGTRITQALALCGGLTEFASRDRIFVLRVLPKSERIRFTYDALIRNEDGAGEFRLRAGDVVVVE